MMHVRSRKLNNLCWPYPNERPKHLDMTWSNKSKTLSHPNLGTNAFLTWALKHNDDAMNPEVPIHASLGMVQLWKDHYSFEYSWDHACMWIPT